MRSKGIKALAVRGDHRTGLAEPERTVQLARDLSRRWIGPATDKHRELGTVANLLVFNDSLILCKFLRGVFDDLFGESAAMLAAVTGWDVDAEELRTVPRRVVTTRKCLNIGEG